MANEPRILLLASETAFERKFGNQYDSERSTEIRLSDRPGVSSRVVRQRSTRSKHYSMDQRSMRGAMARTIQSIGIDRRTNSETEETNGACRNSTVSFWRVHSLRRSLYPSSFRLIQLYPDILSDIHESSNDEKHSTAILRH